MYISACGETLKRSVVALTSPPRHEGWKREEATP